MRLGIIGLPQSGKTTVFNALTRGNQPTTMSGRKYDVHTAVVDVPDERVDKLSRMLQPEKTISAKVTYADIAGLEGSDAGSEISGKLLNTLAQMDGFVNVIRCFEDPSVHHPMETVNAQRDYDAMGIELLINDLIAVERKLERLQDEWRKGIEKERARIERERVLFEKLHKTLSDEKPLRTLKLSKAEEKITAGFGFLTQKPILVVLNLSDGQVPPEIVCESEKCDLVSLQGKLEMEILQLPADEAEFFMAEYGIEELGLQRVIRLSYDLLGLHSFFTLLSDEVRAWAVNVGATAHEAAGVIHSDMQKGFIRAEVISFDEFILFGGLSEARQAGKLRLEGKDYAVQDGDILSIRFNV